jgi:hypothetical protein
MTLCKRCAEHLAKARARAAEGKFVGDPGKRRLVKRTSKPFHGLHLKFSPMHGAWYVMWHRQVLRVFNYKKDALAYVRSLTSKSANDPSRPKGLARGYHVIGGH